MLLSKRLYKSNSESNLKNEYFTSSQFKGTLNLTDINEYKITKYLGQGAYAKVREAIHI